MIRAHKDRDIKHDVCSTRVRVFEAMYIVLCLDRLFYGRSAGDLVCNFVCLFINHLDYKPAILQVRTLSFNYRPSAAKVQRSTKIVITNNLCRRTMILKLYICIHTRTHAMHRIRSHTRTRTHACTHVSTYLMVFTATL